METDIQKYNLTNKAFDQSILDEIIENINSILSGATSKVWHGHPVWFIEDNPIVGYTIKDGNIHLLFWSGQSFEEAQLVPLGKFKAAEIILSHEKNIKINTITKWLKKAKLIQWDYKNLIKRKGELVRLS